MTFARRLSESSFLAAMLAHQRQVAAELQPVAEPENVDELLRKSRPLLVNPKLFASDRADFSRCTGAYAEDHPRPTAAEFHAEVIRRLVDAMTEPQEIEPTPKVYLTPRQAAAFYGDTLPPHVVIMRNLDPTTVPRGVLIVDDSHDLSLKPLAAEALTVPCPQHRTPQEAQLGNPHKAHLARGAQWKREKGRRR